MAVSLQGGAYMCMLCAGRVYTDLVEVVQICAGVNVCSAEFVSVFVVGGVGFLSVCAKGGLG